MRARAAMLVLSALLAGALPAARLRDAFQPADARLRPPEFLVERGVTRWRAVRFRPTPPRSLPLRMRMNFFPDAVLEVVWERVRRLPSGDVEWTGRTAGSAIENAAMIASGTRVTANVVPAGRPQYQVRTAEDGTVWVREFRTISPLAER